MRFTKAILFLLTAAAAGFLYSCTKKDKLQTQLTRLETKWKLASFATDDNGNGAIDNLEIHPVATGTDDEITFNSDGTGSQTVNESGTNVSYPFMWVLSNDTLTRYGQGRDTIVYYLANISSVSLELTAVVDTNKLVAYFYNKK